MLCINDDHHARDIRDDNDCVAGCCGIERLLWYRTMSYYLTNMNKLLFVLVDSQAERQGVLRFVSKMSRRIEIILHWYRVYQKIYYSYHFLCCEPLKARCIILRLSKFGHSHFSWKTAAKVNCGLESFQEEYPVEIIWLSMVPINQQAKTAV